MRGEAAKARVHAIRAVEIHNDRFHAGRWIIGINRAIGIGATLLCGTVEHAVNISRAFLGEPAIGSEQETMQHRFNAGCGIKLKQRAASVGNLGAADAAILRVSVYHAVLEYKVRIRP